MKRVEVPGEVDLYEYSSHESGRILVCSTSSSRRLLTAPAVTGRSYRELLQDATTEALQALVDEDPEHWRRSAQQGQLAVVNVLRGGLSFGVPDAVSKVLGVEPPISFVGTSRSDTGAVRTTYQRWTLGAARVVIVGDILGTGETIVEVTDELARQAAGQGRSAPALIVLAIGSRSAAARLHQHMSRHRGARGGSATILALEGLFELPPVSGPRPFRQDPFDLLRSPLCTAPAFEARRLREVGSLFEKCVIYDGGVRSFSPDEHIAYRHAWWNEITAAGVRLTELAVRTAGLASYRLPFSRWQTQLPWPDSDEVQLREIHRLGSQALEYAEQTAIETYVSTTLLPSRSCPGKEPS